MRLIRFLQLTFLGTLLLMGSCQNSLDVSNAPIAPIHPKILESSGNQRVDNYYWLNERENPEVIKYLEAENAYLKKNIKSTEKFQEKLYDEMISRLQPDDATVPYFMNGYYYYSEYKKGLEYPMHFRKKASLDAVAELFLDENDLAKEYEFYDAAGLTVSQDNTILAFAEDTLSRRIYTIRFKNLTSGEYLADKIENTAGDIAWANDNKTVYYSIKDETLRPYQIWRHTLGENADSDQLVFSEDDATFTVAVYRSKSNKYIMIASGSTLTTESRYLDANDPNGDFTVFYPRERGLEYHISHFGDSFYIRTNLDAKNFKLMKSKLSATDKSEWQDVLPHRNDVLLEDFDIFADYLVVQERKGGLTQLRIIAWNGSKDIYLPFHDAAYTAYLDYNPEFATDILRYNYTSMTTPETIIDYNMGTGESEIKKQQMVLGDFNADNYFSERLNIPSRDGKLIPASVVYRKGTKLDGSSPLLLYGYGSYGLNFDPYFSSARLSLLDRGFIYVIAHIRGSETLGRDWYEDGKLLHKMNTFYDYIDAADYLVKEKYTGTDRLFAMGGSAGGLLMGAVVNLRPDLFKGVVAQVPFVDVVTTMLDESIPLTTGEYDEWGNPNDKVYYDYMLSYSPYDNVKAQAYPAMLVTTGLHDSQVQYFEPAKWVAKLRVLKTDDHPLFLSTNMDAGHGGASGRFQRYKEIALEYAFMFWLMNITE